MKKLITTCAIIATASTVSLAQSKVAPKNMTNAGTARAATPEQIATKSAKAMQTQYGLSDAQYKSVYAVELDYQQQMATAKAQGGPGEGQGMQMNMARDNRFQNIMTPEQYTKYQAANPAK